MNGNRVNTCLLREVAHGLHHDARGFIEQRNPRVDDDLLEQPHVLRRSVVVDAPYELQPEPPEQTIQETLRHAGHGDASTVARL